MTKDYETDTDVQHMIDHYDWHFLPVVNPDGYEFTWTDVSNTYLPHPFQF